MKHKIVTVLVLAISCFAIFPQANARHKKIKNSRWHSFCNTKKTCQKWAKSYLGKSYKDFKYIITRENRNWNIHLTGGIPQAQPEYKMRIAGKDYKTNGCTQIKWAIKYMKNRYGSVHRAKIFKSNHGWY